MAGFRLHLFGHFYLLADGQPVTTFRSQQARALLAYLVVEHHRPVGRQQLAKLLWGGYTTAAAQASLRVSLSNLRQLFRPLELLQTNYQSVQFVIDHPAFWCDAMALLQWSQTAAEGTPAPLPVENSWRNQGEFLEEFDEIESDPFRAWLQQKRTFFWHLRQQVAQLAAATEAADRPRPLPPLTIRTAGPTSSLAPGAPADGERTEAPAAEQGPAPPVAALSNDELALVPRVAAFYGRQAELTQLSEWVMDPYCHLVAILGMGGQGKSALTARLVQRLASHEGEPPIQPTRRFAHLLWSSLLNAPPLSEVLHQWVQNLSGQGVSQLPASLDQQLDLLLGYLRRQRCLLVLDNVESILATGERAGQYRPGYEAYGQLLQRVGEFDHQSCLLLTSREEPYGWARLALGTTAIRSLRLGGLALEAGQTMLQGFGLSGDEAASGEIVRRYSGNPLALKLVTAVIQELFAGDVYTFLADETLVFDDIRDVLDQHFARLLPLEQEVISWLASEREPVGLPVLLDNLVQAPSHRVVLETLRSLHRRSLLEQDRERFGLQNVVLEYTTDHLVEKMCQELGDFGEEDSASHIQNSRLNRFALVKAQTKEYVRESQVRLLLQPVADFLTRRWSKEAVARRLQQQLDRLRSTAPLLPGYAAANLIQLLLHLKVDVRGYDFSHLTIWQADLRGANLAAVNLSHADLLHSLFLEPFENTSALAFSPDRQLLVAGTQNGDLYCWRLSDRQPIRIFHGHVGPIRTIAFDPTGERVASGGTDSRIRLWDVKTGELCQILHGHMGAVVHINFDGNGDYLTSLADDKTLNVWNVCPGASAYSQDQSDATFVSRAASLAVGPGGSLMLVRGEEGQVLCQEIQTGRIYNTLSIDTNFVVGCALSHDGKTLAAHFTDQVIRLWRLDGAGGEAELQAVLPGSTDNMAVLAFSRDDQWLAASSHNQICLWQTQTGRLRFRLIGHANTIRVLAFSPDGRTLASAATDLTIRLWNLASGQADAVLRGFAYWADVVQASPAGATLASCHHDQTVRVWDLQHAHHHILRGHQDRCHVLAYSPDGALLATGGHDTTVRLWDVRTGEQRHALRGHTDLIMGLAFHPTRSLLATCASEPLVYLWNSGNGEPIATLEGHTHHVWSLAFSPDGALLASASHDQTIILWPISDLDQAPPDQANRQVQVRQRLCGHGGIVHKVAFHPGGAYLVSGGDGVLLWDVASGQLLDRLQTQTQTVFALAFSRDGGWLVSASLDEQIHIWRVNGGSDFELRHVLRQPLVKAAHLAISPDSTTLATRYVDCTVRLWDLASGQIKQVLKGHPHPITSVSYGPDGSYLASSSSDGTIRLWDVQSGECLKTLRHEGPYARMNITGVTGISKAQKGALLALGAVSSEQ